MNASLVGKTKSYLEINENSVVEGVFICINCGSTRSTVLKKAVYCRDCRSFKLFMKKVHEGPVYTGHFDDDD
jgi:DNA-directed RNA polymerase subunit RPC12/RpoP